MNNPNLLIAIAGAIGAVAHLIEKIVVSDDDKGGRRN